MEAGRWMEGLGEWPGPAGSGLEREAVSWGWVWSGHAVLESEQGPPGALRRPRTGEVPHSLGPCSRVAGRQGPERRGVLRLPLAEGLPSVGRENPIRVAGLLGVLGAGPLLGSLRVPERGLGGGSSGPAHSPVPASCALEEDEGREPGPGWGLGVAFSAAAQGQKQPIPQPRGLHPAGQAPREEAHWPALRYSHCHSHRPVSWPRAQARRRDPAEL